MWTQQERRKLAHGHSDLTLQLDEVESYLHALQRAPQEVSSFKEELAAILEGFQADYRHHIAHEECEVFPIIDALGAVWHHQVESMRQEHCAIDVSLSTLRQHVIALDDSPKLAFHVVALRSELYLLRQIFRRHIKSERDCLTSAQALIGQRPLFEAIDER